MSQRQLSAQTLQEIRDLAAQWGKIVARRLDAQGTGDGPLDFQAMEQVAAAAAAGLTEGTLGTFLDQQAQTLAREQPVPIAADSAWWATRTVRWPSRTATSPSTSRFATVPTAAGTFSPLRTSLRLDNHRYSPTVLQMIAEAGPPACIPPPTLASPCTWPASRSVLGTCAAGLAESASNWPRFVTIKVAQLRRRELPVRVAAAPAVVAVEVDGGRLRTRAVNCGPGVHQPQNKEDKIACLVGFDQRRPRADPATTAAAVVSEAAASAPLGAADGKDSGDKPAEEAEADEADSSEASATKPTEHPPSPQRRVRTCVASMVDSHAFGPMVAAEGKSVTSTTPVGVPCGRDGAWRTTGGFSGRTSRDFEPYNGTFYMCCVIFTWPPVAWAATSVQRWSIYLGWLCGACWQGRVCEVIAELQV